MLQLDTEDDNQVGSALVINVTQENAGRYICFAEFANITAKQDIYIAILRKSVIRRYLNTVQSLSAFNVIQCHVVYYDNIKEKLYLHTVIMYADDDYVLFLWAQDHKNAG